MFNLKGTTKTTTFCGCCQTKTQ